MRLTSFITAAALVAVGTSAFAQANPISSTAGARIINNVQITKDNTTTPQVAGVDMYFGVLVPNGGGTVTLNPRQNDRSASTVTTVGTSYVIPAYTLAGEANQSCYLTLGAASITLQGYSDASYATALPAGANPTTMSVNNFTWATGAVGAGVGTVFGSGNNLTLNGSGAGSFRVGATLTVGANQVVGYYRGTYQITATYN